MATVLQWGVGESNNIETRILTGDLRDSSAGALRSRIGFRGRIDQPLSFLVDTAAHLNVLYSDLLPFRQSPILGPAMTAAQTFETTRLIRVGNEEMEVIFVRLVNENRWLVFCDGQRGWRDTAPVPHEIGERVLFYRAMRTIPAVDDGEALVVYSSRGGSQHATRDIHPSFRKVNRASLPPCPYFDKIRQGARSDNESQVQNVIGDFEIYVTHRNRKGLRQLFDPGQALVMDFYSLGMKFHTYTEMVYADFSTIDDSGYEGTSPKFRAASMTTRLGGRTNAQIIVRIYATLGELRSWQTVELMLNWRASGTCVGWGCNWGNGYAGNGPPGATGYGYNWGEDFGGGT